MATGYEYAAALERMNALLERIAVALERGASDRHEHGVQERTAERDHRDDGGQHDRDD
jgi:hypothetical protein